MKPEPKYPSFLEKEKNKDKQDDNPFADYIKKYGKNIKIIYKFNEKKQHYEEYIEVLKENK